MAKRATTKKSVGKTSKARSAKSRSASVATKKRSTTKKTTTKKTTKVTTKQAATQSSTLKRLGGSVHGLRGFHLLTIVVLVALIGFMYGFSDPIERTISTSYVTDDALRDDMLAPAIRDVWTYDVRHAVTAYASVIVLASLVLATKGWRQYISRATKQVPASRWVVAAIAGAGAVKVAALLNGVYDITFLGMLSVAVIAASYAGYRATRETTVQAKGSYYLLSVAAALVAVVGLTVFMAVSMLYGAMLPLYIYIATDILALGFLAYAVNLLLHLKGKRQQFATTERAERNFLIITLLTATLFIGAIVLGNVVS